MWLQAAAAVCCLSGTIIRLDLASKKLHYYYYHRCSTSSIVEDVILVLYYQIEDCTTCMFILLDIILVDITLVVECQFQRALLCSP